MRGREGTESLLPTPEKYSLSDTLRYFRPVSNSEQPPGNKAAKLPRIRISHLEQAAGTRCAVFSQNLAQLCFLSK